MKNIIKSLAIAMAVLSMAACRKENFKEAEPVQGGADTFTCFFDDTKAVAVDGVQTFKAGEIIDLLDNDAKKIYSVAITEGMISNGGKVVVFTSKFPGDKPVLAVYPGGYNTPWGTKEPYSENPHFTCLNSKRDGFATAVAAVTEGGKGRSLTFTNVVSCVSFSSSKTAAGDNKWASLYGNDGEKIPSQVELDPATGAASAYSTGIMDYAFTNLAASNPTDIRLWMLPGQEFKKGITLRIGTNATIAKAVLSRVINTPFTVSANSFIRLGDIDKASEGKETIDIATAQEFLAQVIQKPHTTTASRDTTYNITADLDFSGIQIVRKNPAEGQYTFASGEYYANINGNGHRIKNLVSFGPLIQKFSAIAQDIVFDESCSCTLGDNSGGIFIEANYGGIVKNITNYSTIKIERNGSSTESIHHGGIMGINRAYVFDCKNYGPIVANVNLKGQERFGAIIGTVAASPDPNSLVPAETIVKDCENSGDITVNITGNNNKQLFVGGDFGVMDCSQPCTISNCKNSGKVTVNTNGGSNVPYAGGLIGMKKAPTGSVINCENTGDVAIIGAFDTTKGGVAGLLGYRLKGTAGSFATFENCKINCMVSCDYTTMAGMVLGRGDAAGSDTFAFGSKEAPVIVAGAVKCGDKTSKVVVGSETVLDGYTFNVNYEGLESPANCLVAKPGSTVSIATVKGNTPEYFACDAASLLWQDNKNLVKSISIDGCEIKVELNASQEGNAVVAASKGGVVVWSWNIWVLADDVKDVTVGGYTFMDRNVGALTLDEKSEKSIGLTYQYGRKDPFPYIKGYDTEKSAYVLNDIYNANGEVIAPEIKDNTEANNIENSIKNPQTFYKNYYVSGQKHNYNWITTDATTFDVNVFKGLWENDGNKSVYDPCPKGYKVASIAAWEAAKALPVTEIWDNSYETPDASAIGTNEKYIVGNKKKVQFRGCYYGDLKFTTTGEVNANTGSGKFEFAIANCVGKALPTAEVWCANIDPDYASNHSASYFRGTAVKLNTTGNGNYDDISAIKVNALSTTGKYGLHYALPVRCIKE